MPFLTEIPAELLADIYPGLEDIALKQQILSMAAISATGGEFSLVEVENADDAETVAAIFQERIDAQVAGGAFYPMTIEAWEQNSRVVTCGNYILLIVAEDSSSIAGDFETFVS